VRADVANVLRANAAGFDAILLDTDNGPEGMIMSENARLYAARGSRRAVGAGAGA
jgi:spermidine synthase